MHPLYICKMCIYNFSPLDLFLIIHNNIWSSVQIFNIVICVAGDSRKLICEAYLHNIII